MLLYLSKSEKNYLAPVKSQNQDQGCHFSVRTPQPRTVGRLCTKITVRDANSVQKTTGNPAEEVNTILNKLPLVGVSNVIDHQVNESLEAWKDITSDPHSENGRGVVRVTMMITIWTGMILTRACTT